MRPRRRRRRKGPEYTPEQAELLAKLHDLLDGKDPRSPEALAGLQEMARLLEENRAVLRPVMDIDARLALTRETIAGHVFLARLDARDSEERDRKERERKKRSEAGAKLASIELPGSLSVAGTDSATFREKLRDLLAFMETHPENGERLAGQIEIASRPSEEREEATRQEEERLAGLKKELVAKAKDTFGGLAGLDAAVDELEKRHEVESASFVAQLSVAVRDIDEPDPETTPAQNELWKRAKALLPEISKRDFSSFEAYERTIAFLVTHRRELVSGGLPVDDRVRTWRKHLNEGYRLKRRRLTSIREDESDGDDVADRRAKFIEWAGGLEGLERYRAAIAARGDIENVAYLDRMLRELKGS